MDQIMLGLVKLTPSSMGAGDKFEQVRDRETEKKRQRDICRYRETEIKRRREIWRKRDKDTET